MHAVEGHELTANVLRLNAFQILGGLIYLNFPHTLVSRIDEFVLEQIAIIKNR